MTRLTLAVMPTERHCALLRTHWTIPERDKRVILRVIIPVHRWFIRITIFIERRVIYFPWSDGLSLLQALFFRGNNCQKV